MRLRLATEAIDFQRTDSFGKELEKIIAEMQEFILNNSLDYENTRIELQKSEYGNRLSALIMARLGLNVKLIFNTNEFAGSAPLYLNKNHVLLENYLHGPFKINDQEKVMLATKGEKGWVDLKKAKVGGMFSKYEHKVFLNVAFMTIVKDLNFGPKDIVAILLHEIGHLFTVLEFSDRLETTNQVLANLATNIRTKGSKEQRAYLLVQYSNELGNTDIKKLENENNRLILGLSLFRYYVQHVKSQLPRSQYNNTSGEQLSDNFASRFGYGKELIISMDKINLLTGEPEKYRVLRVMNTVSAILYLISGACFSLSLVLFGLWSAPILISAIFLGILTEFGETKKDYKYDDLKIRYKRIRQDYIEMISTLQLSKSELKDIIDSVEVMDKIIKDTVVYRSFYDKIANFVFSKNRHAKADIELQQLIEDLTHNDLFLASAKLQTLELSQGA
jgi:hypothetical protein